MGKVALPTLKIVHKGLIIVLLPLLVQSAIYLKLKQDAAALEEQSQRLSNQRDIATRVNILTTDAFFSFQSLMLSRMYGKTDGGTFEDFSSKVTAESNQLAQVLRREDATDIRAERLESVTKNFIATLRQSQFVPDQRSQASSIIDSLNVNQRFRRATVQFLSFLKELGTKAEQTAVTFSQQEQEARIKVTRMWDVAMGLNALVSLVLAWFFVRGIVSRINLLKDNANRFAGDQPLNPVLSENDEIGELDRVFHGMADEVSRAREQDQLLNALVARSKDQLELVVDNVPSGLLTIDAAGRIRSVNSSGERLFESSADALLGTRINTLFHAVSNHAMDSAAEWLKAASQEKIVEAEAITADGEIFAAQLSVVPYRGLDEETALVVIDDVTERKRLEQAKNDFLAMVSHDIRTPLTAVSGTLYLCLAGRYGEVSEEIKERLGNAESNCSRMLSMVSRLLDRERLERGDIDLTIEEVDMRDIVKEVETSMQRQLEERGLSIAYQDGSRKVRADRDFLAQVLVNLVANAVRYTAEGSSITIACQSAEQSTRISVSDRGPGVPVSKREHIFEKFKQANTRRDKRSGFGLGLSICKTIVSMHGGKIGVGDAQSGGAEFWFDLPN